MGDQILLYQVDAFANVPFSGNPAAICVFKDFPSDEWMQKVASEMNLSETSFVCSQENDDDKNISKWKIRWFTPTKEVELCGHATLATAHILWEQKLVPKEMDIVFETMKVGNLPIHYNNGWIEMDFPLEPPEKIEIPPYLLESLGLDSSKVKYVGKNKWDLLVQVESEQDMKNVQPDFEELKKVDCRCVLVTSTSECNFYDFTSRVFAPNYGINEDPVTGSAHCCLAPFWMDLLNSNELTAYQASKRGGILQLKRSENTLFISGKAVTIFSGQFHQEVLLSSGLSFAKLH